MYFRGADAGSMRLGEYAYRIAPPATKEERAAAYAAVDIAKGGKGESLAADESTRIMMVDEFNRLLAVATRERKTWSLHWGENMCRIESSSILFLSRRWTLRSAKTIWALAAVHGERVELKTEKTMPEPVQIFALWLICRATDNEAPEK